MSFRVGLLGGQGQWHAGGGACGRAEPMVCQGRGLWVGRANGVLRAGLRRGGNVIQSGAVEWAGPMACWGRGLWVGRANGVPGAGLVGGQSQ